MAHIQEKGWYFLIRIKDGHGSIKSNLELPEEKLFDLKINLNITRKQSKEVKELLKDKNHYRKECDSHTPRSSWGTESNC